MSDRTNGNNPTGKSSRQLATATDNRPRRWDPFSMFNDFESEMDRMFGSRFPFMQPIFRAARLPRSSHGWAPSADIYDKDGNLVVKAELPGVDRKDVDVTVENGDLVIQGERSSDDEINDDSYYRMERFTGRFYRRFPLPDGIDEDNITAEYKDGVLEVHIPKPSGDEETPEKKTIEIK